MTTATRQELKTLRVDHTGGLRRPEWLRELGYQYSEGKVSLEELRAGQDRAIREVIQKQEAIGLPVVSDGEFRRTQFQESFGGAVTGFDAMPNVYRRPERRERPETPRRVESGPSGPGPAILHRLPTKERLRLVRNVILEEYRFASSVAQVPVKVTLVGPDRVSQRFEWENSGNVYKDMDDFLADVIAIQRQMIAEVVEAGCRYIQLDEPGYTAYVDPPLLERMRARGEDPVANMERSIAADNAVIRGFPGVTFGIHICRGGGGGRGGPGWHREGTYDAIAERLFGGLEFDRFLLEYDGEHAGSFEPLRFLTGDKIAVLGLVSNHGEVETASYLKQRLEEASRYLPLERIAICPRCGLGGSESEEAQWGKLGVMVEVAREVWGA